MLWAWPEYRDEAVLRHGSAAISCLLLSVFLAQVSVVQEVLDVLPPVQAQFRREGGSSGRSRDENALRSERYISQH